MKQKRHKMIKNVFLLKIKQIFFASTEISRTFAAKKDNVEKKQSYNHANENRRENLCREAASHQGRDGTAPQPVPVGPGVESTDV